MKKIFAVLTMFAFLATAPLAFACEPNCDQMQANATGNGVIKGTITIVPGGSDLYGGAFVQDPASNDQNGNLGTADVTFTADATASSKDSYEQKWVKTGFFSGYRTQEFVPGEAEATAHNQLTLTSDVDIISNSPQVNGLAFTGGVHATTTLDIDGYAKAKGTDGCPQEASVDVAGNVSAYAYGNSFSGNGAGAYAAAGGSGLTTVNFIGNEQDASNYGIFGPNEAYVDFNSTISVNQNVFSASYVNENGTFASNVAFVGGGYATSNLGRDGIVFRDDIQLTGIEAAGKVSQQSRAIDGGAMAYGNSNAYFSGAVGSVTTIPGGCITASPGQNANVGGYAFVGGYNHVSVLPNSITVTSHQVAKATSGNSERSE